MGNYLNTPITEKHMSKGSSTLFDYVAAEMQGWRLTMEDAIITEPGFDEEISLFAIFDGHGGSEVSEFCAKNFGNTLKSNAYYVKGKYRQALEQTFLKMDDMLRNVGKDDEDYESIKNTNAGCTALVCLIVKKKVYIANAGDCRCIIFNDTGIIYQMNREHKPTDKEEFERIRDGGGFVINGRINENLNLSRAIGDLSFKDNPNLDQKNQLIIAFPDVVEKELDKQDVCILLGCDGVFEKLSDHMLKDTIFRKMKLNWSLEDIIQLMMDKCLGDKRMSHLGLDNMSSILIKFKEGSI